MWEKEEDGGGEMSNQKLHYFPIDHGKMFVSINISQPDITYQSVKVALEYISLAPVKMIPTSRLIEITLQFILTPGFNLPYESTGTRMKTCQMLTNHAKC